MRQPARALTRRPVARFATLPAPVAGLNYLDALTQMKMGDALVLDNYFPQMDRVELRRGYREHVTGFTAPVESLLEYDSGAVQKLWAASGSSMFDATNAGTATVTGMTGLSNAKWRSTMFSTSGGQFLVAVNGANGVRTYDGAVWATQAITGASASTFRTVAAHKARLWFTTTDSAKAYYLGVQAIAGAAAEFDLGPFLTLGSTLSFAVSLSFEDSGAGIDDFLCFVSTAGEMIVYRGTDPSSSTTWAMTGRYRIGRPVDDRAVLRLAGDVAVMTEDGLVSLRGAIQGDRAQAQRFSVSARIDRVLTMLRQNYGGFSGWQCLLYPKGNRAILNVPTAASTAVQYVMNTLTGAWCRFTGMDAACWGLRGETLYFGGATAVYLADAGTTDDGGAIDGAVKYAFDRFGSAAPKRFTMARPTFTANGSPGIFIDLDVDFSDNEPASAISVTATGGAWGTGLWGTATWAVEAEIVRQWAGTYGVGIYAAPRFKTSTTGASVTLNAFDLTFEPQGAASL